MLYTLINSNSPSKLDKTFLKIAPNHITSRIGVIAYLRWNKIGYVFTFGKIHAFLNCFKREIQLLLFRHII